MNTVFDFEMNESADVAPNLVKNRKPRTKGTVNYVEESSSSGIGKKSKRMKVVKATTVVAAPKMPTSRILFFIFSLLCCFIMFLFTEKLTGGESAPLPSTSEEKSNGEESLYDVLTKKPSISIVCVVFNL